MLKADTMSVKFDKWYKDLSQIHMPEKKLYFAAELNPENILEVYPEAPAALGDRPSAAATAAHAAATELNEMYVGCYDIASEAKFKPQAGRLSS